MRLLALTALCAMGGAYWVFFYTPTTNNQPNSSMYLLIPVGVLLLALVIWLAKVILRWRTNPATSSTPPSVGATTTPTSTSRQGWWTAGLKLGLKRLMWAVDTAIILMLVWYVAFATEWGWLPILFWFGVVWGGISLFLLLEGKEGDKNWIRPALRAAALMTPYILM